MSALPIGWIALYDAVAPALEAGVYRVTTTAEAAEQTSSSQALPSPNPDTTFIDVGGPRFSLGPADIAAMHPPPGARGGFDTSLPHVALGRRTLPWEREIAPSTPWLALVVARKHTKTQVGEVTLTTGPLQTVVGASVLAALNGSEPVGDANQPVTVATLSNFGVMRSLMPTEAELPLLSHVRQVNVADTALDMGDDDGWFAIVASNRLPRDPTGGQGTDYVALLVSLEARQDVIDAIAPGSTLPASSAAPPLIVLASWEFTSLSHGTFAELAADLDLGLFAAAAPAAADGTVTLSRTDRSGVTGSVTYRSPLIGPAPDAARRLPADGDVTSAAAYEVGRLLGAADGHYTREIVGWHRALDQAAQAQITDAAVAGALGAPDALPQARSLAATVADRLLPQVADAHPKAAPHRVHPAARAALERPKRAAPRAKRAAPDELAALAALRGALVGEQEDPR